MTELYRKCDGAGCKNGRIPINRQCAKCGGWGYTRDHEAEAKIARLDGAVDVWVGEIGRLLTVVSKHKTIAHYTPASLVLHEKEES